MSRCQHESHGLLPGKAERNQAGISPECEILPTGGELPGLLLPEPDITIRSKYLCRLVRGMVAAAACL